MRTCPICHATYESNIDFCFKDGAPLDSSGEGERRPSPPPAAAESRRARAYTPVDRLGEIARDDLMPPEAISLVDMPVSAIFPEEDQPATTTQWVRDEPESVRAAATSGQRASRYRPPEPASEEVPAPVAVPVPADRIQARSTTEPAGSPDTNRPPPPSRPARPAAEPQASGATRPSGALPLASKVDRGTASTPGAAGATEQAPTRDAGRERQPPVPAPPPRTSAPAASRAPAPRGTTSERPDFHDPIHENLRGGRRFPLGLIVLVGLAALLAVAAWWVYNAPGKVADVQPAARAPRDELEDGVVAPPVPIPAPPEAVAPSMGPVEGAMEGPAGPPAEAVPPGTPATSPDRPALASAPRPGRSPGAAAAPTPAAPASAAGTPATPWGEQAPAVAAPPPAATRGKLFVFTNPVGADVYIDGNLVGVAPLTVEIASGAHQLRTVKEGFQPKEESVVLTLKEGELARRFVTLTP